MIENEKTPGAIPAGETLNGSVPAPVYDGKPDDLHDLFGATTSAEEDPLAALRDDPNYSALIRDLEYIASQARLLFAPAEEVPSDEVWTKIQQELGKNPFDPSA